MALLELQSVVAGELAPWSVALKSGECLLLNGPSGSGKSRMLRAIADLDLHQGQTLLDGKPCSSFSPTLWRQQVGMLAAESAWWEERVGAHFVDDVDNTLFESLGFGPEVMSWELARCSTGEKQRLALLRLLNNHPRILLLDEPTASLDPANVARVEQVIMDYLARHQAAAIWVSHDPQQIQRVATRQMQIQQGEICEVTR